MEESQQEATEKEVERILGLLQTYFREDRKYDTSSEQSSLSALDVWPFPRDAFVLESG